MATNHWNPHLYDGRHSFVTKYGEDLLDLLAPSPGERVLDVGCGTGALTAQIAQRGARVVGLDNSAEMLEKARASFPELTWVLGDIAAPEPSRDLAEGAFEAIFSNAVLHWVSPPEAAVRNMARWLKPGGRLVVEFGGKGNITRVLRGLIDALSAETGVARRHDWYYPSVAEYASLLEAHGFETKAAWLFDRPTPLEGSDGLRNWYRMFRAAWLTPLPADQQERVFARAEDALRATQCPEGIWHADYRRIRIIAQRV